MSAQAIKIILETLAIMACAAAGVVLYIITP